VSEPSADSDKAERLFQKAYQQADAVDKATEPGQRRKAWARLIPLALVAFFEDYLRQWVITGAVLLSVIFVFIGAFSTEIVWIAISVVAGIIGMLLPLLALIRRWAISKQWITSLTIIIVQCVLITVFAKER
jgi:hypothetical protein